MSFVLGRPLNRAIPGLLQPRLAAGRAVTPAVACLQTFTRSIPTTPVGMRSGRSPPSPIGLCCGIAAHTGIVVDGFAVQD